MIEIIFYQIEGEKEQYQVNKVMSKSRKEIYRNGLRIKHGKNILFGIKHLT